MTIDDVLDNVRAIIKARQSNYGDPEKMLEEIARRWGKRDDRTTVAMKIVELKMARLRHQWDEDSAIDAIAYLVFAVMFADD